MSILLVFENKDVTPWLKALRSKLPKTTIEVYPHVKNTESVNFIICWKPKKNVLNTFTNAKVIQSVGASVDHIIYTQNIQKSTKVTRIVDDNLSNDMWEFLLSIVLKELKNNRTYYQQENLKIWQQHPYRSIKNTTISILGLGNIGGHVAKNFAQLGFKVRGWSNSKKQILNVKSYNGKDEFYSFLKNSDFLINLLPLTKETKNILNKSTLQNLPKTSFLINVGRGEHLVEKDIIELLDSSMLSGALLDVFRNEPLPNEHPFWNHPKIQITPHIGSLTNIKSVIDQIVKNYERFLNNDPLLNTTSLKKGY